MHEGTLSDRIAALPERERQIISAIVERLERGRRDYGPWGRRGRDYRREMLEEVYDALVYAAAELTETEP